MGMKCRLLQRFSPKLGCSSYQDEDLVLLDFLAPPIRGKTVDVVRPAEGGHSEG